GISSRSKIDRSSATTSGARTVSPLRPSRPLTRTAPAAMAARAVRREHPGTRRTRNWSSLPPSSGCTIRLSGPRLRTDHLIVRRLSGGHRYSGRRAVRDNSNRRLATIGGRVSVESAAFDLYRGSGVAGENGLDAVA